MEKTKKPKEKKKAKVIKKNEEKPKPLAKTIVKEKPAVKHTVVKAAAKAKPKPSVEAVEPKKKTAARKKIVPAAPVPAPEVKIEPTRPAATLPHVEHPLPAVKPVTEPVPLAKPAPIPIPKPASVTGQIATPKPQEPAPSASVAISVSLKDLEIQTPIMLKDLAVKLQLKPSALIKDLMGLGMMVTITQNLNQEIVDKVCAKYGFQLKQPPGVEDIAIGEHAKKDKTTDLLPRAPIVTIMGHVDHGKTSILDAIRKSKIAEFEHGGITQHIGAYRVSLPSGEITFLDTPGHEAFTAMRSRGAKATDIVVLVIAADDGVMPQTREAIDHAKAAGVVIIVALNKIDKPQAEPDRVKKQLSEMGLLSEDWGGKTIMVNVSAKTGQGINELLEMILLESQMLELKANPNRLAKGVILEAKLVKNRGPVATLLVQNGTLRLNDNIIVGNFYGKIRAMFNDRRQAVQQVGPSCPVEVLGITDVPLAGEPFFAVAEEKKAKELARLRQERQKQHNMQPVKRMTLEDLSAQVKEGKVKELKLILKADAQGSVEAIKEAIKKIPAEEVSLVFIHEGVGNITSSDVILAVASDALILGFNVVPDISAKELIDKESQEVRVYNVIYELVNDLRAALEGMLEPKLKKVFLGRAEVKKIFKLSSGNIAGCMVSKGNINRHAVINVMRNGKLAFEGSLSSLKRFKDDVREVEEGYECGLTVKGFNELAEGDVVEAYEIKKIARTLE